MKKRIFCIVFVLMFATSVVSAYAESESRNPKDIPDYPPKIPPIQTDRFKKLLRDLAEEMTKTNKEKPRCLSISVKHSDEYKKCPDKTYKLAEWCSGDCSDDDAKITICCPLFQ